MTAPVAGLVVAAVAFALGASTGWQPRPGALWWLAAGSAAGAVHLAMAARDHLRTAAQLAGTQELLRHGPVVDRLTGIGGSGALLGALGRQWEPGDVAVVELRRLDAVRVTWGPDHADALEREVAERLAAATGEAAVVARMAPGRYAVARASAGDDATPGQELHRQVNRPVRLGVIDADPGARVGVVAAADLRAPGGTDPAEILAAADLALRATTQARPVARYEPGMRSDAERRVALAAELQAARSGGELEVYFQPLTGLADGRIRGAEALLRWHHPRRGTVDAADWVRVAEEIGLLPQIGRDTLAEACRHFAALAARRPEDPLRVSVNLSGAELAAPGLVDHVATCLSDTRLAPSLLVVEVREAELAGSAPVLAGLRDLGVRLAVDDAGAGGCPLATLREVAPHQLKVDATLVAGLPHDEVAAGLVAAVAGIGRALGAEVVAEGVTTEAQVEAVRAAGVDLAQGYLYGRALPFSRFVATVARIDAARRGPEAAGSAPVPPGAADEAADPLAELG